MAISAIQFPDLLVFLGFSRLANLNFIALYVAAACFSVFSSCLLFLKCFLADVLKFSSQPFIFKRLFFLLCSCLLGVLRRSVQLLFFLSVSLLCWFICVHGKYEGVIVCMERHSLVEGYFADVSGRA